jgi:pimeloyl-ACP methyl ester carboxylesterase
MEQISHFFHSDRLKLQFWDYGQGGKPALVLVHGGLDHARSWDWVARSLRAHFHVYALDLRGHGNSVWAPGAIYSVADHILDLSVLLDIISAFPIRLMGHSLGGNVVLHYAGLYPDRVCKAVSIEGFIVPQERRLHGMPTERLRYWVEAVRNVEMRPSKSYPSLDAAMARMKEANPRLSEEVARHLTLHGTNWEPDGSLVWKFDHYMRVVAPYGFDIEECVEIFGNISCPTLLFCGLESYMAVPESDPRMTAIRNCRLVKVPNAGHWVHHDQLDVFLRETTAFFQR